MRHVINLSIGLSPKEVNDRLINKWGISLFRFAQVFAVSPIEMFIQRSDYPFSVREIKEIKQTLKKMRDTLFKGARHIRKITEKLLEAPGKEISDDELVKEMRLGGYFNKYVHKHEILSRYVEKTSLQGKRGVQINKKSIVAVGWGNLVSQGNRRIDWKILGDLYFWFWHRVGSHDFYDELKPVYGIEEYLRHQYMVHRWVGGAANYICTRLQMSQSETLTFVNNLFMQRFVGGNEDYFREKLPMAENKFRTLFQNIFIDSYLGEVEGLTVFTKNQSFADPWFLLMHIWLGKATKKNNNSVLDKDSRAMVKAFKNAEMPYKDTQVGNYLNFALEIYFGHKVKISEMSPLIIFPDKSYFSTCF